MRKLFHNDTVLRVVSVLISILLWMYVVGVNNPTVSVVVKAVPVQFANSAQFDASGLKVISVANKTVDVKIEGRHFDVSKISANDIIAQVDVSKMTSPGNYELDISLVTENNAVNFKNITANKTSVFADYVVSVNKDITVETKGEPKEGFVVEKVSSQDKQVLVRGPKSIVDTIKGATVSVDIDGADGTISKNCALSVIDTSGRKADLTFVTTNITETAVNVAFTHQKEVSIIPKFEDSSVNSKYNVSVNPASVKITGDADIIKSISQIDTEALVLDTDNADLKKVTLQAKLNLPQGVLAVDDKTLICEVVLLLKE
ncbi:MAG: hypothetical protein IJE46_05220 [Clostridia bacterium]|nr:hypothetical protein [Clostridia bacterium]